MNTRVQVEHCVTEAVTGIDIVREQIRVAAGEPLSRAPGRGGAARARDRVPHQRRGRRARLRPAPGTIAGYREPAGPGVRVDSGVEAGSEITPLYDPMVAKLIVWDADRAAATRRMARALDEFEIEGVATLLPFHRRSWPRRSGRAARRAATSSRTASGSPAWRPRPLRRRRHRRDRPDPLERTYTVEVSGKRFDVRVLGEAGARRPTAARRAARAATPARRPGRRPGAGGRRARLPAPGQRLQGAGRGGRDGRGGRPRSASSRR